MALTRISQPILSRVFWQLVLDHKFPKAETLLKMGADVDSTIDGRTLVWWAFKLGKVEAAIFLITHNANVLLPDGMQQKNLVEHRPLIHLAIELVSYELVVFLIKKVNINEKDLIGRTPLQLALSIYSTAAPHSPRSKNMRKIIKCLVCNNALIPDNFSNLIYLKTEKTKPKVLEYFDKGKNRFIEEKSFHTLSFDPYFDVAVIFFAASDGRLDGNCFGAIASFFTPLSLKFFITISEQFHLFRAVIQNIDQMETELQKLTKLLNPQQSIKHFMLIAHGNQYSMALSDGKEELSLSNIKVLKKTIDHLPKDATIALAGCDVAKNDNNLAKAVSAPEISNGRMVISSGTSFSSVRIQLIYPAGKPSIFPFFKSASGVANAKAYKNGIELVNSEWPMPGIIPSKL